MSDAAKRECSHASVPTPTPSSRAWQASSSLCASPCVGCSRGTITSAGWPSTMRDGGSSSVRAVRSSPRADPLPRAPRSYPRLMQCTHSPRHSCTLLTAVAALCVWCRWLYRSVRDEQLTLHSPLHVCALLIVASALCVVCRCVASSSCCGTSSFPPLTTRPVAPSRATAVISRRTRPREVRARCHTSTHHMHNTFGPRLTCARDAWPSSIPHAIPPASCATCASDALPCSQSPGREPIRHPPGGALQQRRQSMRIRSFVGTTWRICADGRSPCNSPSHLPLTSLSPPSHLRDSPQRLTTEAHHSYRSPLISTVLSHPRTAGEGARSLAVRFLAMARAPVINLHLYV
jgi:hypothetical protein